MKYSQLAGVLSAIILVFSGFLHWAWYPDLQKYFTGFYSENNIYGKPGSVFIFFAVVAITFFLFPKIWAKRWNILVCSLTLAYAIKTFIFFSQCYRGICPDKQAGLWIMLSSAAVMMLMALLPDIALPTSKEDSNK